MSKATFLFVIGIVFGVTALIGRPQQGKALHISKESQHYPFEYVALIPKKESINRVWSFVKNEGFPVTRHYAGILQHFKRGAEHVNQVLHRKSGIAV